MPLTTELLLVFVGMLLAISILASQASSLVRMPVLVFFILLGMLLGSEGLGGIPFDDAGLARTLGTVALVFILFGGGLDSSWGSMRAVLLPAVLLSTFGVVLTAAAVGVFTCYLFGLSFRTALLLGAIVSSTDAAAVFGVLRSRGAATTPRPCSLRSASPACSSNPNRLSPRSFPRSSSR